jgi:hypothetical protein
MSTAAVTMCDVEGTLERECSDRGFTQSDAASTYAWGLLNEERGQPPDWGRMNAAIRKRWPAGLNRVKTLAQKQYKEWTGREYFR